MAILNFNAIMDLLLAFPAYFISVVCVPGTTVFLRNVIPYYLIDRILSSRPAFIEPLAQHLLSIVSPFLAPPFTMF